MEYGMTCTNSECSTEHIVDDLIECPDCGENKIQIFPIIPERPNEISGLSFAVCLHSLRRGTIISTHYVTGVDDLMKILQQCALNTDVNADFSWVANAAEYVKICNTVAGLDMDKKSKSN
jgi:hypothetical protein